MSNSPLSVRAKIAEVDVYDADDVDEGSAGHIDVRYWLERGDKNLSVADIRIYFKRTDVSLDDLRASALAHAHRVLSQAAGNYTLTFVDSSPENLWVE
jgi:hypothetical protein